jgi:crossover junction endodeoxyribonuclease RusA
MYRSPKYAAWLKESAWMIVAQTKGQKITGYYTLILKAVAPDKRRRDLDNLLKAASDVLTHSGVITDDYLCRALRAEWVLADFECEITIEAVNV